MAGSSDILEINREASDTVRLEIRKETCKFRFTIENFKLCESYNKEDGGPEEFESMPFFAGGSGMPQSQWCIKVKFLHDKNTKIPAIDCIIYCILALGNCKGQFRSYIVSSTGELKPCVNNTQCDYAALLKNADTLLPNGALTVECHLWITYPAELVRPDKMSSGSNNGCLLKLQFDLQDLFESQRNSDVVLHCGDEDIKAHKCILSTRSPVFAKMFEHDMKENMENFVTIEDASPQAIRAMLQYIYCGKIEHTTTDMHMQLYSVADRYDLKELKGLNSKFMASNLSVENLCKVAILAHLCHDEHLLSAAKKFFDSHYRDIVGSTAWMGLISKYQDLTKELLQAETSNPELM